MSFRYSQINDAPVLSNLLFNNQNNITVSPYQSIADSVYITADISDAQGCLSLVNPNSVCTYRSGSSDTNCYNSDNVNSKWAGDCAISNCSGAGDTTATLSCSITADYLLAPTDAGTPYASEY